jgi:dTDP-4-dehydrorhamnose 3,5-epimerase
MNMTSSPSSKGGSSHSDRTKWHFTPLVFPDVVLIEPPRFGDLRGWFSETYNTRVFDAHGINLHFVQDNVSVSANVGTVRGLHYQLQPYAQDKLVRVINGRILDVVVDVRNGSPTFGKHLVMELSRRR